MLQWLRNTSLKHIFMAVSAVYLLVTLALGGYALSVNRSQNESLDWSGGMFLAYNALQSAQTEILNARRGARTYLLYGDESGMAQYRQSLAAFDEQMRTASASLAAIDESESELARQIQQADAAVDAWVTLLSRGGGVADIAGYLAILAGYAVVLLSIASLRLRRSLVTP